MLTNMERMSKYTEFLKSIDQCVKIIFCESKENSCIYSHFMCMFMCVYFSIYVFVLLNVFQKAKKHPVKLSGKVPGVRQFGKGRN